MKVSLKENMREILQDIGISKDFFSDRNPQRKETEAKSRQIGFHQTKKETTEWRDNLQSERKYLQTVYLKRDC